MSTVCLCVCSVDYRNHHLGLGHSTEEAAATVQQEYTMHGYSLNCYKKIIVPIYYGGKWVGLWWLTGHCSSQSASESACVVWHDSKVRHTKPATTAVFVTRSVMFAPSFFSSFRFHSHTYTYFLSCHVLRYGTAAQTTFIKHWLPVKGKQERESAHHLLIRALSQSVTVFPHLIIITPLLLLHYY